MIDFNALSALATSVLTPHNRRKEYELDVAVVNGCGFPDSIAASILGVELVESQLPDEIAFNLGFGFALKLGALLALDPLQTPDIKAIIVQHKAEVAQSYTNFPKCVA
jgi:hypothetical protein